MGGLGIDRGGGGHLYVEVCKERKRRGSAALGKFKISEIYLNHANEMQVKILHSMVDTFRQM